MFRSQGHMAAILEILQYVAYQNIRCLCFDYTLYQILHFK